MELDVLYEGETMLPVLMIVLCVALRVVPHPPNFAPVGATAVFAGRTLPPWLAIGLTWVAMFLGDLALSQIHGYRLFTWVTPFVYGGFAFQALLGRVLRRRRGGALGAAALGATAFFVLSNLGVWVGGRYGHTWSGLFACYVAAIPFFGPTLASDVLWTLALTLVFRGFASRLESRGRWWVPPQSTGALPSSLAGKSSGQATSAPSGT